MHNACNLLLNGSEKKRETERLIDIKRKEERENDQERGYSKCTKMLSFKKSE